MMSGGVMPGGRVRTEAWQMAVICATPSRASRSVEKDLDHPMPGSDCDSMCSMSLTVVVSPRSLRSTIREPISEADMPA